MPWHDRSENVQLPDQPGRQKFFPVNDNFVFFQKQSFTESDTRDAKMPEIITLPYLWLIFKRTRNYSSSAISLTRCSTAFCSSSPSAEIVTTVPWVRPRVCSLNKLFALALLPLEVTVISEVKPLASFYKLGSRAGVQTVRSGNGNFLLEHCISPTYRFSVVELKSSLAVRL